MALISLASRQLCASHLHSHSPNPNSSPLLFNLKNIKGVPSSRQCRSSPLPIRQTPCVFHGSRGPCDAGGGQHLHRNISLTLTPPSSLSKSYSKGAGLHPSIQSFWGWPRLAAEAVVMLQEPSSLLLSLSGKLRRTFSPFWILALPDDSENYPDLYRNKSMLFFRGTGCWILLLICTKSTRILRLGRGSIFEGFGLIVKWHGSKELTGS